jgi:alkaline phosphatase D
VLTVWDDHDYGLNDAGAEFKHRDAAERLFDYVWAIPEGDPRRARPGVYGSWMLGPEGGQIQIIMLDTRYFRSPLKATDEMGAPGKERYLPDNDRTKTMLGDAQWAWLESELRKPAKHRVLVSSIQVVSEGHGWEAWRLLPAERDRLVRLLRETGATNTLILSGDRHFGGFYRREIDGVTLNEVTSSSINLPAARWRAESGETRIEPDPNRLGDPVYVANFGLLEFAEDGNTFAVTLRGGDGAVLKPAGM